MFNNAIENYTPHGWDLHYPLARFYLQNPESREDAGLTQVILGDNLAAHPSEIQRQFRVNRIVHEDPESTYARLNGQVLMAHSVHLIAASSLFISQGSTSRRWIAFFPLICTSAHALLDLVQVAKDAYDYRQNQRLQERLGYWSTRPIRCLQAVSRPLLWLSSLAMTRNPLLMSASGVLTAGSIYRAWTRQSMDTSSNELKTVRNLRRELQELPPLTADNIDNYVRFHERLTRCSVREIYSTVLGRQLRMSIEDQYIVNSASLNALNLTNGLGAIIREATGNIDNGSVLFRHLVHFMENTVHPLTDEEQERWIQLSDWALNLFDDDTLVTHLMRLDDHRTPKSTLEELGEKGSWKGKIIRLHETVELLSLREDRGHAVDGRLDDFSDYWFAHERRAIPAENFFALAHAKRLNYPLTARALEFLRVFDDGALYTSLCFSCFSPADLANRLGRGGRELPTIEELQVMIRFLEQTSIWGEDASNEIALSIWSRFFFRTLSNQRAENHAFLIILIAMLVHGRFTKDRLPGAIKSPLNECSPYHLLEVLQECIEETPIVTRQRLVESFSTVMDELRGMVDMSWETRKFRNELYEKLSS